MEYENIIKTYLDTNSEGSSDLIFNGSIKENIEKRKDNLNTDDAFNKCELNLEGIIYLKNVLLIYIQLLLD